MENLRLRVVTEIPWESPAAKTLGACGPSGFGLGTFLGRLFTTLPPQVFQIISQSFPPLAIVEYFSIYQQ